MKVRVGVFRSAVRSLKGSFSFSSPPFPFPPHFLFVGSPLANSSGLCLQSDSDSSLFILNSFFETDLSPPFFPSLLLFLSVRQELRDSPG